MPRITKRSTQDTRELFPELHHATLGSRGVAHQRHKTPPHATTLSAIARAAGRSPQLLHRMHARAQLSVQDEKRFRAKVSDFGLSAHMAAGQTSVEISHGTEAYLPLEVFKDLVVTQASDIYALGLLMWEIYYGIFWFGVWDAEKRRRKCVAALPSADVSASRVT